jgi:predicted esterase
VPLLERYPAWIDAANAATPILTVHGNADDVITHAFATRSYKQLEKHLGAGGDVEQRSDFDMEHYMSTRPMMDMQYWFQSKLLKNGPRK